MTTNTELTRISLLTSKLKFCTMFNDACQKKEITPKYNSNGITMTSRRKLLKIPNCSRSKPYTRALLKVSSLM
uniref:Uncharacterized protein n=1 Tax=Haematobia irritans TaxID=7368 RepID=A0A1L8E757_HAEIR